MLAQVSEPLRAVLLREARFQSFRDGARHLRLHHVCQLALHAVHDEDVEQLQRLDRPHEVLEQEGPEEQPLPVRASIQAVVRTPAARTRSALLLQRFGTP